MATVRINGNIPHYWTLTQRAIDTMGSNPPAVHAGERYGRFTVIGFHHKDANHRRHYLVRCDCGKEKTVQGSLLRNGNTRSCGCLGREKKKARRVSLNHSEVTNIILLYKRHASRRGLEWSLTREEVEGTIFQDCAYCGSPPSNVKITKNTISPLHYSGIDREDNSRGYIPGNAVPCCRTCNFAKRDMSKNEFISWAKKVAQHDEGY